MKRLFVFGALITLFALFGCPSIAIDTAEDRQPILTEETKIATFTENTIFMVVEAKKDLVIENLSVTKAGGNEGGTISKGTIFEANCNELICLFPDSYLFVMRSDVEVIYVPPLPGDGQTKKMEERSL